MKSPMDLISRIRSTKTIAKREKAPIPKKTPNRYFVGKLDKPKRGLPYRIFRQRKSLLGNTIDEVCMHNGWNRMKTGYKRVGPFLKT